MLPNKCALLSSGLSYNTCTQSWPTTQDVFWATPCLIVCTRVTEKMRQLCHAKVTVEWLALLMR